MSHIISIQKEVIIEIKEAVFWYNEKRSSLGDELYRELLVALKKIELNPQHYTFINRRYRRIKINRFPYLIIYEIENNNIIINSFFHISRRPKF